MKKPTQKELWLTMYEWLKLCGCKPNQQFCREEISTHPDYPSLLAAVDFLESGAMNYEAVQADASYIHEFNYPVLAHIKKPGQEYIQIIPNADAWEEQKEITQHWSGAVLYAEKNAHWQNPANTEYQVRAKRNQFVAAALSVIGLAIFIISSFHFPNILVNAFGLFSLAGIFISIYAMGTELGFQNKLVKQVCGAMGGSGGCEQVLKSKYAKGVAGITPADAGAIYFTCQFLFYLVGCWVPAFIPFLLWMSLGGILIVSWSLYTQAVKLKQWCALCLGIAGVLILQIVLAVPALRGVAAVSGDNLRIHPWEPVGIFMLTFFLFALILLPVKALLKANFGHKQKLAELKKWKLDAGLFIKLWQEEREVDTSIWENDLLLGNAEKEDPDTPPLTVTIACSTYCGPCAQAHTQLHKILNQFEGKLRVLVRFICDPADANNKLTIALRAILQNAATITAKGRLEESLSDWFEWMNYEKWITKWKPDPAIDVGSGLIRHQRWATESNIAYTPDLFLNGRKIPGRYTLDDLVWMLPQLTEMMKSNVELAT